MRRTYVKKGARRSQAAVEFLMTYGWAIFVMLSAIGALAYFGVFDLDQFLVEKCTFTSGVICVDHIQTPTGVSMVVQNAMGIEIADMNVTILECSNTPRSVAVLPSGDQVQIDDTCNLGSGAPFRSAIVLEYLNPQSGLTHIKRGEIVGRVQ